MAIRSLPPRTTSALRRAPLSVPAEVTPDGRLPPGYRRFTHSAALVRRDLEGAAAELFSWRVHHRAGLGVRASDDVIRCGTVVQLRLGLGAAALRIPCRVITVIEEPNRRGFTYATLPGHPETGVECFLLERGNDGRLTFTVSAVSTPATLPARLAWPVARAVQDAVTRRYLRGLGARDDLRR